MAAIRVTTPV